MQVSMAQLYRFCFIPRQSDQCGDAHDEQSDHPACPEYIHKAARQTAASPVTAPTASWRWRWWWSRSSAVWWPAHTAGASAARPAWPSWSPMSSWSWHIHPSCLCFQDRSAVLVEMIAFQENIALNPVHQNPKPSVSQLRRAPARLLLSSLAFEPCCAVFAVIFSWNAIVLTDIYDCGSMKCGAIRSILGVKIPFEANILYNIMSCPTNGHETRIAPHFVLPQS